MSRPIRVAVIGAGAFGKNHLRVLHELPEAELVGVVEPDLPVRNEAILQYGCRVFESPLLISNQVDAAIVATPTSSHSEIGLALLNAGIDVLIEKPIAASVAEADALIEAAERNSRVLQVGHLERFNPAVEAVSELVTFPLFFEVHRLSMFSPRSLDVDVILDLMIHDLDVVLALSGMHPVEIHAAGVSVMSRKVDIANVRLAFANGCIANLTASRVSTERVRKLRLFQPRQYISLDYQKQDAVSIRVDDNRQVHYQPLAPTKEEPLRKELQHFLKCVRTRQKPRVDGVAARRALALASGILAKIEEHAALVHQSLQAYRATQFTEESSK